MQAAATESSTPAPEASAAGRATTFTGAPASGESVPGGTLMVTAYAIVWVVVLLMVVRVFQRQSALAKKVEELEADVAKSRASK
jgi:CcmD family protein